MILFFFFGLSIAAFLFLLTLVKRNKTNADRILAAWMGFMTLHLLLFVLDYSGITLQYPYLLGVLLPFPILHGLFLYLYTLQTISNSFPARGFVILHLVPFILLIILATPFYLLPGEQKIQVYLNQGKGYEWYSAIQISMFVLFGFAYSIASVIQIKKHRRKMLDVVSNHEKKQLIWLEWMSYGLACIWLLASFFDDEIIFSGVVLFILFIGVFGINQTPVFLTTQLAEKNIDANANRPVGDQSSEKYQRSGLTEDDITRLAQKLETFMGEDKPFRNPDLTLDVLAALLNVQPHQLSQVINSHVGKTFYHYINSYRIKEFLTVASQPESSKFTYLGIAYDCGFQSKTTFNKYFKIETGKTPSEYFQTATAA